MEQIHRSIELIVIGPYACMSHEAKIYLSHIILYFEVKKCYRFAVTSEKGDNQWLGSYLFKYNQWQIIALRW